MQVTQTNVYSAEICVESGLSLVPPPSHGMCLLSQSCDHDQSYPLNLAWFLLVCAVMVCEGPSFASEGDCIPVKTYPASHMLA